MTPLQRENYAKILQVQRQKQMNPKNNEADKLELLKKFSRDTCVLNTDQEKQLEGFVVKYHDVFPKHRFDVGYNTELKIKLTPEHPLRCMFNVHQLQSIYVMKF